MNSNVLVDLGGSVGRKTERKIEGKGALLPEPTLSHRFMINVYLVIQHADPDAKPLVSHAADYDTMGNPVMY